MKKIVGVRFREGGKVYDFDPGHFVLSVGDYVMVKTEKGFTVGKVVTPPRRLGDDVEYPKLKKIFRLATEDDLKQYEEMLQREKRAFAFCKERIEARG
ncbi:MAG TPA: stage 0 sporulation protein, partial [Deltaproteobacteria bacterium]|nr:stage 0 sporulation protein [Deltaproteobacteria bacterium]